MASPAEDCDVLIVGYGPVGQTLTIMLAERGYRVIVLERWAEAYPRPRAVHFDDEIARVFASAGIGEEVAAITQPSSEYHWRNAAGQTLLRFEWGAGGPSGWPNANMFCQPRLEAALAAKAESFPSVDVQCGWSARQLTEHDDHVEALAVGADGTERRIRGRYVVGCDGANSFVRDHMGTGLTDLGFFYDWLILDVVPHDRQRVWKPLNLQICDPRRPTTVVSGGPGKRRWEFMRLPGETIEELNNEQTAWRLLEPWDLTPANAVLERHTVYTFQARWADRWRDGRILIAGDAAHLMPPFAGQGLCSGIRDAANLAWKLDLVLSGCSGDPLLDTYTTERSAHIQNAIRMSVELGNVICLTDPAAVAARDEVMLKAEGRPEVALPPIPPPVLGPGVLATSTDGSPAGLAGQLSPQGRVAVPGGTTGRFDEVIGTGFVLAATVDLYPVLSDELWAGLRRIGARVVRFAASGEASGDGTGREQVAVDVDSFYLPWLREAGCEAIMVRPDFYFFGTAEKVADVPGLLQELFAKLGLTQEPAAQLSSIRAASGGAFVSWRRKSLATPLPGQQEPHLAAGQRAEPGIRSVARRLQALAASAGDSLQPTFRSCSSSSDVVCRKWNSRRSRARSASRASTASISSRCSRPTSRCPAVSGADRRRYSSLASNSDEQISSSTGMSHACTRVRWKSRCACAQASDVRPGRSGSRAGVADSVWWAATTRDSQAMSPRSMARPSAYPSTCTRMSVRSTRSFFDTGVTWNPWFCALCTMRCSASRDSASRTTLTLTPNRMRSSPGLSRVPGGSSPDKMSARICA
jgi:flavoprotein hydroxylase